MSILSADDLLQCLTGPIPAFSSTHARQVARDVFGIEAEAEPLAGERDGNFALSTPHGRRLLKITNRIDPEGIVDLQCKTLRHIESQDPSLPVPRVIPTVDGAEWGLVPGEDGLEYRVRMLTFLEGAMLGESPADERLMRNVGVTLARQSVALRGFFHAHADHPLAWDIKRAHLLGGLTVKIEDARERESAERAFTALEEQVVPRLGHLRAQVIHNDVSFHNTVVDPARPWAVTGIYDFGDVIHAPLIQELAVAAAEIPAGRTDPLALSAAMVAGFHSVTPLESEELEVLPIMMATRLAMSFAITAWKPVKDNREYYDDTPGRYLAMIEAIQGEGYESVTGLFSGACGVPPAKPDHVVEETSLGALQERRARRLGKHYELSYERPLHAVRGDGVWLYDADGSAYLDFYNNVPSVGHCHPRVVAAIARQAATLNTNTRYLYESVVDLGDRLTATLPNGLDVCMLVSSGSEANDLAWRIASVCTGNSGGIVMHNAYHGVTQVTADLSPEIPQPGGLASYVETIAAADDYRGPWRRDDPSRGARYAEDADAAIERLAAKGHKPAMFLLDAVMSSNGIFALAPGFLSGVYERIRAAGGLCVADEVQAGFGRTGEHMWGFERDAVVPDIVTFGKPIGNGHPLGAVVTTRELAERFQKTTGFFSTTGGNPVSCAAALAVLDVIDREDLQRNALERGRELQDKILQLSNRHPIIGDVRGPGLFIGVELVRDRTTLEPATEETHAVVNGLREGGVLVGQAGQHDNVLKVRPPIVLQSTHIDSMVEAFDKVLTSIG